LAAARDVISHHHRHSFPTRRSSDLLAHCISAARGRAPWCPSSRFDLFGRFRCILFHLLPEVGFGSGLIRWLGLPNLIWQPRFGRDRKSTRQNSSHVAISYAVFSLKT